MESILMKCIGTRRYCAMNFSLLDVSIAKRRAWNRTDVTPPPVCFLEKHRRLGRLTSQRVQVGLYRPVTLT